MITDAAEGLDIFNHTLDHIGLLSKNIEKSVTTLFPILGIIETSDIIVDPLQDVKAVFAKTEQGLILEFLEPMSDNSPIKNSLDKNNNLIHHLAYRTNNLAKSAESIRDTRGMPIGDPKEGIAFGNALIQFFILPDGWLLELIEQPVSTLKFPNKL